MKDKTRKAMKVREILRARKATVRLAASLRRGRSLATHALAAGADPKTCATVVNGLRTAAKRLGLAPVRVARTHRTVEGKTGRTRSVQHWTSAQVAALAAAYSPRSAAAKLVAATLRSAA